jgi:hypothetical protein
MIGIVLAYLDTTWDSDLGTGRQDTTTTRSRALSPEAWQALRYAITRLAIDLVAGPDRLASILRRGLLDEPFNSKSVILDVGFSDSIPGHIRRAVQLRAKGYCEWPGCRKRVVYCDVHHLCRKSGQVIHSHGPPGSQQSGTQSPDNQSPGAQGPPDAGSPYD